MPISMSRLESGQYYLIKLKTEYSSAMTSYIGTFVGLIPYEKSKEPKFLGSGFITPIYDEGQAAKVVKTPLETFLENWGK